MSVVGGILLQNSVIWLLRFARELSIEGFCRAERLVACSAAEFLAPFPVLVYVAMAPAIRGGAGPAYRASFRRFCAVAASRISSRAPESPLRRNRSSLRMRLRWANAISTFLRSRRDCSNALVWARART